MQFMKLEPLTEIRQRGLRASAWPGRSMNNETSDTSRRVRSALAAFGISGVSRVLPQRYASRCNQGGLNPALAPQFVQPTDVVRGRVAQMPGLRL
jgi:hypothetical protein